MEIDTKRFTMMIVGLAVAIILVSGMMIPVISSLGDNSGGEEEVLYTNTGEYYYNTVTASTSTVLSFDIQDGTLELLGPALLMSINGGEAKMIVVDGTEMPMWTSEQSFNFTALPLFTFITSDGKYGVEGIATIGNESMDAQYIVAAGGVMYYRFIEGQTPELYYCFDIDSLAPLTITMTNGVVSYSSFNQTPTALNGTYLLSITDGTTGDFTLMSGPTVLNDTPFYMADFNGDVSIEVEGEGSSFIVLGEAIGAGCYGQISDYSDPSNLCIYDFGRSYDDISAEMNTTPAESGEGVVLENLSLQSDDSTTYELHGFIVPTKITTGGGSGLDIPPTIMTLINVIPLITVIGILIGAVGYLRMKD